MFKFVKTSDVQVRENFRCSSSWKLHMVNKSIKGRASPHWLCNSHLVWIVDAKVSHTSCTFIPETKHLHSLVESDINIPGKEIQKENFTWSINQLKEEQATTLTLQFTSSLNCRRQSITSLVHLSPIHNTCTLIGHLDSLGKNTLRPLQMVKKSIMGRTSDHIDFAIHI